MLKPLSGIVGALVIMLLVGPSWAGDGTSAKLAGDGTSAKQEALEEILLSLDSIRATCEKLAKASNSEGGPEDTVVAELVDRVIPAVRGASTQTTNALRKLKVRNKRSIVKIRSSGGEKRFHADKVESSEERTRFHAAKVKSSEKRKRFHAAAAKAESEDPMDR